MAIIYNQRGATRNQSTVDYTQEVLFFGGVKSRDAVFLNNTGADLDVEQGILVLRDVTTPGQIIPAIAGATLANVIGVLRVEGVTSLADAASMEVNYATSGEFDSGLIVFPATVNLDTTVGAKHLLDVITGLGFDPKDYTDSSIFDN